MNSILREKKLRNMVRTKTFILKKNKLDVALTPEKDRITENRIKEMARQKVMGQFAIYLSC